MAALERATTRCGSPCQSDKTMWFVQLNVRAPFRIVLRPRSSVLAQHRASDPRDTENSGCVASNNAGGTDSRPNLEEHPRPPSEAAQRNHTNRSGPG